MWCLLEFSNWFENVPSTLKDWKNIIKELDEIWNIAHRLWTINGKHILMRQSENADSLWHNYNGFSSIVSGAFSFIDVGNYESNSDNLNIPPHLKIRWSDYELSYFLVGDEIPLLQ